MYELIALYGPMLEKIDGETLANLREVILNLGGIVKKENVWEKRKLAYPIKKQLIGQYIILEYQLSAEKTDDLQKQLRLNDDILRFLIITKPLLKEEPKRIKPFRPKTIGPAPSAQPEETKGEKVKIEELNKKLEELLKE